MEIINCKVKITPSNGIYKEINLAHLMFSHSNKNILDNIFLPQGFTS